MHLYIRRAGNQGKKSKGREASILADQFRVGPSTPGEHIDQRNLVLIRSIVFWSPTGLQLHMTAAEWLSLQCCPLSFCTISLGFMETLNIMFVWIFFKKIPSSVYLPLCTSIYVLLLCQPCCSEVPVCQRTRASRWKLIRAVRSSCQ